MAEPLKVYLVVFNDSETGPEILSAWTTKELAEREVNRQLERARRESYDYHDWAVRLRVEPVAVYDHSPGERTSK